MEEIAMDPNRAERRRRTPLWIALGLLMLTIGLGATRLAPHSSPGGGQDRGLALRFQAPGGGAVGFSGQLDRTAVLAGGDGLVGIELAIRGAASAEGAAPRVPSDLVVVLDQSGSMAGEKIVHARAAIRELVSALAPEDRFALVSYSFGAYTAIPLAEASDASREGWLSVVEGIYPGGGTNLASGLELGLEIADGRRGAGRTARVILISDGLANQGDTSLSGLRARARRAALGEYTLTTIGVGEDFDEQLLAALADAGTGNYYYIQSGDDLARIFSDEFETARESVARGLAVSILPAAGVEVVDAAGYPLERGAEGETVFRPGTLFAGQERRIWVTLRTRWSSEGIRELGGFALGYTEGEERKSLRFGEAPRIAVVADPHDFYASVDPVSWSRSVTVDQYNDLRRKVAAEIKAGNPEAAESRIEAFRDRTRAMNEAIQSPGVAAQLEALEGLAAEVEEHSTGRRVMAPARLKEMQALGYREGRAGDRKSRKD
jgi:Ca-activated chloride channel family protein